MLTTGYNNDQSPVKYRRQVVFQKLHALKMSWKKTCILTAFCLRMYSHGSHDHWEVARSQWLVLLPFVEMSNTKLFSTFSVLLLNPVQTIQTIQSIVSFILYSSMKTMCTHIPLSVIHTNWHNLQISFTFLNLKGTPKKKNIKLIAMYSFDSPDILRL